MRIVPFLALMAGCAPELPRLQNLPAHDFGDVAECDQACTSLATEPGKPGPVYAGQFTKGGRCLCVQVGVGFEPGW